MRKYLCGALLACLSLPVLADPDTHPVTLWLAEGERNSVYLLGSIHLLRPDDYPLPSVIDAAYEDAEALVMELDMDDLDPAAAQQLFSRNGVLRDGTTLRDLMGHDLYERASRAAQANDIPLDLLASSEPWLAAVTVEIMALYRIGFDPALGVEMLMTSRAAADGKPIDGLEGIEEQLAFLDGLSLDAQRQLLLQALEESANIRDSIDAMIDAWRYGDLEFLESEMLDDFAQHKELHEALLAGRNRRWVSQIRELLDNSDDYLVVVGALHLVGEDGVPGLLAEEGVRIRQLSETVTVR